MHAPARMLEFLILTAARAGEVLGARWSEIDLAKGVWTIPGERMKGGKEHIVPLSEEALAIVESIKGLDTVLVFPGRERGHPWGAMTLRRVMESMGVDVTVHGFRSTFRDWAGDCTDYPRDLVEIALAHAVESEVEAAYRRSTAIEKRRKLMEAWAAFCAGAAVDNVVQFASRR
jgi:integrase